MQRARYNTVFIEVRRATPTFDISHEIIPELKLRVEARDRDGADPRLIMYGPVRYTTYGK